MTHLTRIVTKLILRSHLLPLALMSLVAIELQITPAARGLMTSGTNVITKLPAQSRGGSLAWIESGWLNEPAIIRRVTQNESGGNGQLLITAGTPSFQGSAQTYKASTDFSGMQGQQNWYYLDSAGTQLTFLSQWGGVWNLPNTGLYLGASWGHPGDLTDAVRQWRAPGAGSIRITGTAFDGDSGGGDGVKVSIKKGTQVLWERNIENADGTGFSYDVTTSVAAGDQINFEINRRSNAWWDSTTFDPTITYTSGGGPVNLALNKAATQSSDLGRDL